MSNFLKYFLLLSWISYLLVCGVLLFSRGFLLRRQVLTERSRCFSNLYCAVPHHPNANTSSLESVAIENSLSGSRDCEVQSNPLVRLSTSEDICSEGRAKVVLIIIDALRYDFVAYSNSSELNPFENRLTAIHNILEKKPDNTRLFKFIADPPTTTMQRLQALTTGGLPSFIDMGSNFASKEINEDNIIDQLRSKGKKVVFLGDDTWTSCYPRRFEREYPYPSFNVWDLDTVDNGVRKHLLPEIRKGDWSLMVAHFLGVDHCGHRYGPFHSEMTRKLDEMNDVIREIMEMIQDDTLLIVLGDHGMTRTGDHGGETQAEVTAGLFMYYPSGFLSQKLSSGDSVNQIDIVPTLATALGVPIPFSNIGTVIVDSLPKVSGISSSASPLPDWQFALLSMWSNARQAFTYLQTYAKHNNDISKANLESLSNAFISFSKSVSQVSCESELLPVLIEGKQFLLSLLDVHRKVWVQFDTFSLTWGLIFTFVVLIVMFLIIESLSGDQLTSAVSGTYLSLAYLGLLVSGIFSYVLFVRGDVPNFDTTFYIFNFGVSFVFLAAICAENLSAIFSKWSSLFQHITWTEIFCRILCLFSLWALTSNSYVEAEGPMLSFFLLSLCSILVYTYRVPHDDALTGNSKLKTDKSSFGWLKSQVHPMRLRAIVPAIAVGVAVRMTHSFWRCRDEQFGCTMSYSKQPFEPKKNGTRSADPQSIIMLLCMALWVTITRMWQRSCGNLTGYIPTVLFARYVPTVLAVCSGGFWVLQGLPGDTRNRLFKPWQLQIFPWTVYSLVAVTLISLIIQPLCVLVLTNHRRSAAFSMQLNKNPIPQLYHHMKKIISGSKDASSSNGSPSNRRPVVYGLATAYSAAFTIMAVVVVLVLGLLLGSTFSQAIIAIACAMVALLLFLSVLKYENAVASVQLLGTTWPSVLCWSLLAQYAFYGTGHQATFSSIQWDAAMVGTGGNLEGSKLFPAILVVANTFCSHILMGLLLPLLLIAPFTLHVMLPRWACVQVSDEGLAQGELMLFQRKDLMYRSLTTLTSRYIFLQGSRILACMLAATIHARHLMVWAVFAPKFVFEAFALFVTLPCVLLSFLLMGRVTSCLHKLLNTLDASASKTDNEEKRR